METNNNLPELQHILEITAEGFYDAVVLIAEFPPELYEQGLSSCERWLSMLARDLDKFKKEVIEVNQHVTD